MGAIRTARATKLPSPSICVAVNTQMASVKTILAPPSDVDLQKAAQVEEKLSRALAAVQNLTQRLKDKKEAGTS